MAGSKGSKEIATRYPLVSGLTARTTSQTGHTENLKPTNGSLVSRKQKTGISGL